MKYINYCFILSLAVFLSCDDVDLFSSLSGSWWVSSYTYLDSEDIEFPPDYLPGKIEIYFEDNGKKGEFSGNTITNNFVGTYKLRGGKTIEVNSVRATLIGEPRWGQLFWERIKKVDSFDRSESRLWLFISADSVRMELSPLN